MPTRILLVVMAGAALLCVVLTSCGAGGSRPLPDGSLVVHDAGLAVVEGGSATPVDLTGINVYQLTSDWSVNAGCGYGGWTDADLDAFFASLRPGSLVRTWFFQSMATSGARRDWTALDRVVHDAASHRIRLIAVLANGNGVCGDGEWKTAAWFAGGYRAPDGVTSYARWVQQVVARYARSPAIGMWEPVNEANPVTCTAGSCSSSSPCASDAAATADLTAFFTTVGGAIHALAPDALVADGSLGTGNCGTETAADYARVISSRGLNVVDYHDYSSPTSVLPSDLPRRLRQARAAGKATVIEESGVTGCGSGQQRAADYARKITAAFAAGASGYLPWWYADGDPSTCDGPIDKRSATFLMLQSRAWTPAGRSRS